MDERRWEANVHLASVWNDAARHLDIRLVAPFQATEAIVCLAYLSDFGGPKGMILDVLRLPEMSVDRALVAFAEKQGFFWSFVHPETYSRFDRATFIEALKDWGYFGSPEGCPAWLE